MILKLNSTSFEVATSILQVQIPAYKVEADYLNSTAIPRLYDTVNDIQNCVETFYGYFSENKLVGFISFVQEEKLIDIHRLVVSPNKKKKGIATKANTPAITLYKKHGFITVSDTILPDGMILTQLKKTEYTK